LSFKLVELYLEAPGFAVFLTITALTLVVVLTAMALGRTWHGARSTAAGVAWTNISVRHLDISTKRSDNREAAVERNRTQIRSHQRFVQEVAKFVPRWKRRHQLGIPGDDAGGGTSSVIDVSHLFGRTSEAQRMQGELHLSSTAISPMALKEARRAKEIEAPLDISRALAIHGKNTQRSPSISSSPRLVLDEAVTDEHRRIVTRRTSSPTQVEGISTFYDTTETTVTTTTRLKKVTSVRGGREFVL
jgi:hypothetical protein